MQHFAFCALSAGFLLYLPRHLSRSDATNIDKVIKWPYEKLFTNRPWNKHLYYEALTLLAGYVWLKTAKPSWERIKQLVK